MRFVQKRKLSEFDCLPDHELTDELKLGWLSAVFAHYVFDLSWIFIFFCLTDKSKFRILGV